ncbi:MAG TPA: SufD family Fe-S cluster assembly protein [Caulobacterales bacterium]|jgi:Fe-S cluster assembly protein SufD|nr:SufD family Fe-S cluster assembly protein [Caulobacterales bacterium]
MDMADLPTRRTEAWKWSDLRLALRETPLPAGPAPEAGAAAGPIEQLARLQNAHETLRIGAGEARVLIERFESEGLDARMREIEIGAGGTLTRVVIQSGAGVALSGAAVSLGENAALRQVILAEGGRLARIETHIVLAGAGARVEMSGLYMCAGERHADLTSVIEHKVAGGTTQQLVKGAVRAGGRGVFQGKIVVDRGAQKTDARQHHQALLLEEGAEAFAKPELIINADDVQCAHGNTIGALDEQALFYMRQRGLPEAEARALLTEAFLLEALPEDLDAGLRDELAGRVSAWLRARA